MSASNHCGKPSKSAILTLYPKVTLGVDAMGAINYIGVPYGIRFTYKVLSQS
jgi:hypothetical protein